jgi:hypothetical protein
LNQQLLNDSQFSGNANLLKMISILLLAGGPIFEALRKISLIRKGHFAIALWT